MLSSQTFLATWKRTVYFINSYALFETKIGRETVNDLHCTNLQFDFCVPYR